MGEEEAGEPPGLVGDAGQLLGPFVHLTHKIVILLIGFAGGIFAAHQEGAGPSRAGFCSWESMIPRSAYPRSGH